MLRSLQNLDRADFPFASHQRITGHGTRAVTGLNQQIRKSRGKAPWVYPAQIPLRNHVTLSTQHTLLSERVMRACTLCLRCATGSVVPARSTRLPVQFFNAQPDRFDASSGYDGAVIHIAVPRLMLMLVLRGHGLASPADHAVKKYPEPLQHSVEAR